jgi:hypothetical protein
VFLLTMPTRVGGTEVKVSKAESYLDGKLERDNSMNLWWSQLSRQFAGKNKIKLNRSRCSVLFAGINERWRLIVQCLMQTLVIVKGEVRAQVAHGIRHALIFFDVHLLIFDTAP